MKNVALCLLSTAVIASSACSVDVHGGEESVIRDQRRFAVTGTPHLTVRSFNGSVELRAWDRDEILLDVERRAANAADARDIVIETSASDRDVTIEAKPPRRKEFNLFSSWPSRQVRMVLTVPRRVDVDVRTGDGAILARDLMGRVELRTGDGSVRVQGLDGQITVGTGDGSVTAGDLKGSVFINTGDGSVNLSGRLDELTLRTGDGAVDLSALPGSTMKGGWRVSTGDGGVKIFLPKDFNADIDAHTGDGGIRTEGVDVIEPPRDQDGRRMDLRGRVGRGGEMLTVRTGDGPVDIAVR